MIKEIIETLEDVQTILKTSHMCRSLDGECTKEEVEVYKERFWALSYAIKLLKWFSEQDVVDRRDLIEYIRDGLEENREALENAEPLKEINRYELASTLIDALVKDIEALPKASPVEVK